MAEEGTVLLGMTGGCPQVIVGDMQIEERYCLAWHDNTVSSYVVVGEEHHSWVEPHWGSSWHCRPECSRTGQWCGTSSHTPAAPWTHCSSSVPTPHGSCPFPCEHTYVSSYHTSTLAVRANLFSLNTKLMRSFIWSCLNSQTKREYWFWICSYGNALINTIMFCVEMCK